MRGKAKAKSCEKTDAGITPAYAGKSACFGVVNVWDQGSPPPMRGKVSTIEQNAPAIGITPAYAGKSLYHRAKCSGDRDHPRLCGEKDASKVSIYAAEGSPPPMRGKGTVFTNFSKCGRITPAYAGKSSFAATSKTK